MVKPRNAMLVSNIEKERIGKVSGLTFLQFPSLFLENAVLSLVLLKIHVRHLLLKSVYSSLICFI